MNATATQAPASKSLITINGAPLLQQLAATTGSERYRYGKLAYDYLGDVVGRSASDVRDTIASLSFSSLQRRDLGNETEAALAFAAAAVLDTTKAAAGRRMTATELVEAAMTRLDDELSAGW